MGSSVHYVSEVTVTPVLSTAGEKVGLYTLGQQYAQGKEYHRYFSVYVPSLLLPKLLDGEVAEIHIEALSRGSAGNRAKHLNYCDNSLISRRYLTTLAAGSVVSANNVLSNNGKPELIQCVVYFVPYYVIRYYIPSAPVDVRQNATF